MATKTKQDSEMITRKQMMQDIANKFDGEMSESQYSLIVWAANKLIQRGFSIDEAAEFLRNLIAGLKE